MSSSTGHIVSNKNNRNLQRKGSTTFYKYLKLSGAGNIHHDRRIKLTEHIEKNANQRRRTRTYVQLGIIASILISLGWYVMSV